MYSSSGLVRRLEVFAWTVGFVLLLTYTLIRTWSALASDSGVQALERARSLRNAATSSSPGSFNVPPPDISTWSDSRVAAYGKSFGDAEIPEAVLRIPALKLTVPVYEGTSESVLNRGAGHIEGTARVGDVGNMGIAGHRDGFFRALKDVEIGQLLYLDTMEDTLAFRIVGTEIVNPTDVRVLAATSSATISLVTCYPFYFVGPAPKRFIVRATRVARAKPSRVIVAASNGTA